MVQLFLAAIFVVHALVFGWRYLRGGRTAHSLAFSLGFIALAAYHGHSGWPQTAGPHDAAIWQGLRWAGVGLCAAATPRFATSLARRLLAKRKMVSE